MGWLNSVHFPSTLPCTGGVASVNHRASAELRISPWRQSTQTHLRRLTVAISTTAIDLGNNVIPSGTKRNVIGTFVITSRAQIVTWKSFLLTTSPHIEHLSNQKKVKFVALSHQNLPQKLPFPSSLYSNLPSFHRSPTLVPPLQLNFSLRYRILVRHRRLHLTLSILLYLLRLRSLLSFKLSISTTSIPRTLHRLLPRTLRITSSSGSSSCRTAPVQAWAL